MTDPATEAYERLTKNLSFDSHGVTEAVDQPHDGLAASNSSSNIVDSAPAAAIAVPHEQPAPNASSLKLGNGSAAAAAPVNGDAGVKYAPGGKVKLTNYPSIANATLPLKATALSATFTSLSSSSSPPPLCSVSSLCQSSMVRMVQLPPSLRHLWRSRRHRLLDRHVHLRPSQEREGHSPGKPIEFYMDIKDPELRKKYHGDKKIPYQVFHDAYFAAKIEPKMPLNELLELRWDWCSMQFTWKLFEYVLFNLIPTSSCTPPSRTRPRSRTTTTV